VSGGLREIIAKMPFIGRAAQDQSAHFIDEG
jgi:hypothetical protein